MENQKPIPKLALNSDKLRLVADIFRPSGFGIFVYLMIFVLTVVISQPSQYKTDLATFHINELQGTFLYSFVHGFIRFIDTQFANDIAIYVFWALVATGVYILATRLTRNVNELTDNLRLRDYFWPSGNDKNGPLKTFLEQLIFRVFMVIVFIVYVFKIGPLLANMWRTSNLKISLSTQGIGKIILLFILEVLFMHGAVIIVRMFLMKHRIVNARA